MNGYRVVGDPYVNQPYQPYQYRVGDMIESLPSGASVVIIDNVSIMNMAISIFCLEEEQG